MTNQNQKQIKKDEFHVIERYEGGMIYIQNGKVKCQDDGYPIELQKENAQEILNQFNIIIEGGLQNTKTEEAA
jgi:hypothetical protein